MGGEESAGAEALLDQTIAELLARDAIDFPPYPAIALRIGALVRAGDYGLDELARLVTSDQSLATDVLRVANSAGYSHGIPTASVAQAVARVGAEELARVALASALGATALARGPLANLRRLAWRDALSSALLCRELARTRGLPGDDAFTCGLLHDFGRVIAIGAIERIAAGQRLARPMSAEFWNRVVDRHHVALGVTLAARWELPHLVIDAVALHHEETDQGAESPAILDVIRTVDPLVGLLRDRSHLQASLDAVGKLTREDGEALRRVLRGLAGYLASFERDSGSPDARLLVRPPRPAPAWEAPPRPEDRRVRFRIAGQDYEATGFGPNQLFVRGPAPLPEEFLLEVEALHEPGLVFHARVLLCWPEGEVCGALLMPFALTGPALLHWQGLVPAGGAA
ncbi:MAG TPA: HDOD domain-containing protein [Anaeromyxobacter sp.]|nr:HDOD domain-containing protein [Anaeromyxobacter sp.]